MDLSIKCRVLGRGRAIPCARRVYCGRRARRHRAQLDRALPTARPHQLHGERLLLIADPRCVCSYSETQQARCFLFFFHHTGTWALSYQLIDCTFRFSETEQGKRAHPHRQGAFAPFQCIRVVSGTYLPAAAANRNRSRQHRLCTGGDRRLVGQFLATFSSDREYASDYIPKDGWHLFSLFFLLKSIAGKQPNHARFAAIQPRFPSSVSFFLHETTTFID